MAFVGDHPWRQWGGKDFIDEPIRKQEVQQPVQGHHWRRFPYQGGDGWRQAGHDADLGYCWTGEASFSRPRLVGDLALTQSYLHRRGSSHLGWLSIVEQTVAFSPTMSPRPIPSSPLTAGEMSSWSRPAPGTLTTSPSSCLATRFVTPSSSSNDSIVEGGSNSTDTPKMFFVIYEQPLTGRFR